MTRPILSAAFPLALAVLGGCSSARDAEPSTDDAAAMNPIAEQYVKLVLAVGRHDPDYVDAYYGPPEWKAASDSVIVPLAEIGARADSGLAALAAIEQPADSMAWLRRSYLTHQLGALAARVDLLGGKRMSFDEESKALYDAVAPSNGAAHFDGILSELDSVLPGRGPVAARYAAFRKDFLVPPGKVDTIFRTAIAACKARTARHIALPAGEEFTVEYVTGKTWSGYNWYQGNAKSLIQVNTDLPIYVDRAIDLACHEGYPGHHVYNAELEQHLVRDRGWVEYTAYPLFSPQSLIAEGSANFGIDMAFPGGQRSAYERDSLFPLAGIDPARAEAYYRVQGLVGRLNYAGNEAARDYLDGRIDRAAAEAWLVRYALSTPEAAAQRVRFMDQYRSYVINYNLGRDLVAAYVDRVAGPEASEDRRWAVFGELLSSPRLPSDLQ